jgi:hypothetical protein
MPETTGNLASGGSFRAASYILELLDSGGRSQATFDPATFTAVTRVGQVVTITRRGDSEITINAASLDDAGKLESALRATVPPTPVMQPGFSPAAETSGGGVKKVLLFGCLGIVGLFVVLGIIGVLVGGGDDDDGDQAADDSRPTATQSAGAAITEEAADDEPTESTDADEPTAGVTESAGDSTPTEADATAPPTEAVATATSAPQPTAAPAETGKSRSNPVPFGETVASSDWEIQVLEVVRGEPAFARLLEVNQFNSPAPEGYEYVLVNTRVKYVGDETEAQDIHEFWFRTTGDARVQHDIPSAVDPEPVLDASLFTGGEASGWSTFLARQGETNLMLVFDPFLSFEDDDHLYLALEQGANIAVPTERLADENDLGFDRSDPVPVGERIVGETWEVWVIESVRGADALARIKEVNQFNEDPPAGMEYVLVHVGARNIGDDPESEVIEEYSFKMTGDAGRVYDPPSIVDPEPDFTFDVYSGGEVSGWITMMSAVDEQNLKLVYEPFLSFTAEPRYLAIQ